MLHLVRPPKGWTSWSFCPSINAQFFFRFFLHVMHSDLCLCTPLTLLHPSVPLPQSCLGARCCIEQSSAPPVGGIELFQGGLSSFSVIPSSAAQPSSKCGGEEPCMGQKAGQCRSLTAGPRLCQGKGHPNPTNGTRSCQARYGKFLMVLVLIAMAPD